MNLEFGECSIIFCLVVMFQMLGPNGTCAGTEKNAKKKKKKKKKHNRINAYFFASQRPVFDFVAKFATREAT